MHLAVECVLEDGTKKKTDRIAYNVQICYSEREAVPASGETRDTLHAIQCADTECRVSGGIVEPPKKTTQKQ